MISLKCKNAQIEYNGTYDVIYKCDAYAYLPHYPNKMSFRKSRIPCNYKNSNEADNNFRVTSN